MSAAGSHKLIPPSVHVSQRCGTRLEHAFGKTRPLAVSFVAASKRRSAELPDTISRPEVVESRLPYLPAKFTIHVYSPFMPLYFDIGTHLCARLLEATIQAKLLALPPRCPRSVERADRVGEAGQR